MLPWIATCAFRHPPAPYSIPLARAIGVCANGLKTGVRTAGRLGCNLASLIRHGAFIEIMGFTVFLGNLPTWVTKDDIKSWLAAENLVSDDIKVIRNPETQESKGFAFIEAPNQEEMQSIIKRFDRAPLEDRLLRANPAQPPKARKPGAGGAPAGAGGVSAERPAVARTGDRPPRRTDQPGGNRGGRRERGRQGPQSAFAEELAKAL